MTQNFVSGLVVSSMALLLDEKGNIDFSFYHRAKMKCTAHGFL